MSLLYINISPSPIHHLRPLLTNTWKLRCYARHSLDCGPQEISSLIVFDVEDSWNFNILVGHEFPILLTQHCYIETIEMTKTHLVNPFFWLWLVPHQKKFIICYISSLGMKAKEICSIVCECCLSYRLMRTSLPYSEWCFPN